MIIDCNNTKKKLNLFLLFYNFYFNKITINTGLNSLYYNKYLGLKNVNINLYYLLKSFKFFLNKNLSLNTKNLILSNHNKNLKINSFNKFFYNSKNFKKLKSALKENEIIKQSNYLLKYYNTINYKFINIFNINLFNSNYFKKKINSFSSILVICNFKKNLNFFNFSLKKNLIFIFYNFNKFNLIQLNFNSLNLDCVNTNLFNTIKYLLNINDNFNLNFISNKYLIYCSTLSVSFFKLDNNLKKYSIYNNFYPIIIGNKDYYNIFFKKIKNNFNLNYIILTNKVIINFLENFLKKKIFLKVSNNYFFKLNSYYFNNFLNEYKNYQPVYWKNFLILDFLEIIWYSFLLKDLKMLSEWITKFMESLSFKNHKKFLSFFNNFLNKYSGLFIDVLRIKGFFFDIRGKVGVTGSSKKRHFCFKFGSINKSSKKFKINFNQNLVRTYSGVMGLTYIISY